MTPVRYRVQLMSTGILCVCVCEVWEEGSQKEAKQQKDWKSI